LEGRPVAKTKRIVTKQLFDLASVLQGRHLISVTVGPALEPILLSLEQPPGYRTQTDHGSFPRNRAGNPNQFRIHHLIGLDWNSLDLAPTRETHQFVQPLPGQPPWWLLVRSRADSEQDHNAHVHGADGSPVASYHAGDAIADVQATAQGHAWISYFDEGVFGDTTLGRNGLVCLDLGGTPVFRFGNLADPVVQSMADCYALNVCSGKEVWLCYHTDFPLVQLIEGTIAGWWSIPVHGSHAFAVDGGRVLLGSSYGRLHKDSLFLGKLDTLDFQELTPTDNTGHPLKRCHAFGRRHLLYLATEAALHVVDLRSL
jgi:hypothetical protein